MIDIEPEVFTAVATRLTKEFPDVFITSEPIRVPPSFPCVSIYEADNTCYDRTQDSGSNENHVKVMYEVCVFSIHKSKRKSECKNMLAVADSIMLTLGLTRISKTPIVEGNIYRLVGRYDAVISKNKTITRR